MNKFDVSSILLGLLLGLSWYLTRNWVLNNILGLTMALTSLKMLRLNKLLPGLVLLGMLFFYDIFWVFYSTRFTTGGKSVMVAVATGFDAPIKLLMPHITMSYPTSNCSLLGLGDIVIPGVYIGFLVRFGKIMTGDGQKRRAKAEDSLASPTKAYRNMAFLCYIISLLICGLCLWKFHNA